MNEDQQRAIVERREREACAAEMAGLRQKAHLLDWIIERADDPDFDIESFGLKLSKLLASGIWQGRIYESALDALIAARGKS